jgi:uncharacterized delta-60 repeat protein
MMNTLLKKFSKATSSLLSLAIISSSMFVALPVREVEAAVYSGGSDALFHSGAESGGIGGSIIRSIVIQPDGKIIVAGNIDSYNQVPLYNIIRFNSDGSMDTSFDVGIGFDNDVYAVALQSDGKILIGGYFTTFDGVSSSGIVRLNSDGSIDSTFSVGTGAYAVRSLAIQSDGKIIIGGNFSNFNGISSINIARLNSNGSFDSTFNTGLGVTGSGAALNTVSLQSDGKVIIGGQFDSYNGTAINRIARLNTDGSLDTSFNVGTGANGEIYASAIQTDGKIILGGYFNQYNDIGAQRIVRINNNGSIDASFNTTSGADSYVMTVSIQSDGKVILGGHFDNYASSSAQSVARLNTDGSIDSSFNIGNGTNGNVKATAILQDGSVAIGGAFESYNDTIVNIFAIVDSNGSIDASFNNGSGPNNYVASITIQGDGKVIIGGNFTLFSGIGINRIARLNTDGSLDATFNVGSGANNTVNSIAIQDDGKVIIGGGFTSYNGTSISRVARLNTDGSLDATFNVGSGADNTVNSIAIQDDGKVIIGGNFTLYNSTSINRVARLNTDGSLDATFNVGSGANNTVNSIAIQDDGKVIIGGNFTLYNSTSINRVARLNTDGSLDATFNVGIGANSFVYSTGIQSDGKVIIGGNFTTFNGTGRYRIARLNTNGSLDVSFDIGSGANGIVRSLDIQTDGGLIIVGSFTTYNGIGSNRLARISVNGSLDPTFNIGAGANSHTYSAAIQDDGKIIIAGDFTTINGITRNYVTRLTTGLLYQADNLDPSLDLGINGTSLKVGTTNGSTNPAEPVTLKASGNVPLSDFVVDFSNGDVDFSGVTAGSDAASGKAFLSGLNNTAIPELSPTHTLYIPKLVGQTSVHICPDATQMSEVFMGCSNGYTLNYGTASNLSIVNIDSQDYWRVTGLTGTGGLGTYSNGVSLTITPNNGLENVAQEVDVTYTSGGGFVNGDMIQLTWDAGITLANCATPTTDADGDLTNDGSSSVTGQTYTYTYSGNATSSVDLCMSVQGLSGNYAVTLNDDNGSFSSALYYINPEGGDVNVIANIAPTLSFNIRNIDDSADLNVCNFGDVSTSTPIPNTNGTVDSGECGYSLAVGTNSSTGFTMQMSSNGALTNGVSNINNVVDNGTWSAGEEAYGIAQVIVGQTGRDPLSGDYDQSLTREGNFLTDTTPVPTTATDFVTYTDGVQYEAGNLDTDVTKVIHGLVVGAGTPAGSYSQVVTYTVTASF